jgi:hypothetical protein
MAILANGRYPALLREVRALHEQQTWVECQPLPAVSVRLIVLRTPKACASDGGVAFKRENLGLKLIRYYVSLVYNALRC